MTSAPSNTIRSDVQGLRAIAVIAVFIFHLYPERFSLGYLGVDVFAVISGFVVTSAVLREVRGNASLQIGRFILRRARRLMPVLFFVTAATLPVWLVMAPVDTHRRVSAAAVSTVLGAANLFFYGSAVDYFAGSDSPYLHYWSLSMEEQFYLILIIAVAGVVLLRNRFEGLTKIPISGASMVLLSFTILLGVAWVQTVVSANRIQEYDRLLFYFPIGRAWQFLAGIAVAASTTRHSMPTLLRRVGPRLSQFLVAVVAGILVIGQESVTEFLSWQRIAVTYLTAAAIFLNSATSDAGFLARGPLVAIGDRSYSIYLWHIPVIRLWHVVTAQRMSVLPALIMVAVASEGSYQLVEQPFRSGRRASRISRSLALGSLTIVLLSAGLTSSNWIAEYVATRHAGGQPLSNSTNRWEFFASEVARPECSAKELGDTFTYECGTLDMDTDVVLVGDSHALALSHVFLDAATELNLQPYVLAGLGCQYLTSPALTVDDWNDPSECEQITRNLHRNLLIRGLPFVVSECPRSRFASCPDRQLSDLEPRRATNRLNVVEIRTSNIARLAQLDMKFTLVQDLPIVSDDIRRKQSLFTVLFTEATGTSQLVDRQFSSSYEFFHRDELALARLYSGSMLLFDPAKVLCDRNQCNGLTAEGKPIWANEDHLTVFGSELLHEPLRDAIQRIVVAAD